MSEVDEHALQQLAIEIRYGMHQVGDALHRRNEAEQDLWRLRNISFDKFMRIGIDPDSWDAIDRFEHIAPAT